MRSALARGLRYLAGMVIVILTFRPSANMTAKRSVTLCKYKGITSFHLA